METKKLGIIGGLGPMATATFLQMIVEMTDAQTDQEHIEIMIHHCPKIPDRTSYILGESDKSPLPEMVKAGKSLVEQGVDLIAIPCVTAMHFYEELSNEISVPILHAVAITRKYLLEHNIERVGLMATTGTIQSGIFQKEFRDGGCELILPSQERQKDVMHLIYQNVKANKKVEMDRFEAVSRELKEAGAQVIILGCTELSVLHRDCEIGSGYLDVMQLMAKDVVELCGKLKEEYQELITGGTTL